MAIEFARPRFIQRSRGHNVVQVAAYNMRDRLYCERTGERTPRHDPSTLVHHEIILPAGANARFGEAGTLWNAVQAAERRKDSQEAFEVVLALPANREISSEDRLALVRSFAIEHFASRGLAVQIDIHSPHGRDSDTTNHHAHLLVTTRRIEGNQLSSHKATDLMPKVRHLLFGPIVAEGELWGPLWRDHQNKFFSDRDKGLVVDPVAPVPQEHIGPVRFRGPNDPRMAANEQVRQMNAKIARDPAAVAEHLGQQPFDGRALGRFLAKHISDPEERAKVEVAATEKLQKLKLDALETARWADKVPSGLRDLSVEDIARELSIKYGRREPDKLTYAELLDQAKELRQQAEKEEWTRNRQTVDKEAGAYRVAERKAEMGIPRRVLHFIGEWRNIDLLRDLELKKWSGVKRRGAYVETRSSIRLVNIKLDLERNRQRAEAELEILRPEAQRILEQRQLRARNARADIRALQKNTLRQNHTLKPQARL